MSSIVALKLFAGAKLLKAQKNIENLWKRYQNINRILTPNNQTYRLAGKIVQKTPDQRKDVMSDVLIAVTAREIGA